MHCLFGQCFCSLQHFNNSHIFFPPHPQIIWNQQLIEKSRKWNILLFYDLYWLNMHCLLPQMWKGCILSILFFLQTLCQLVSPLNKDGGQPRAGLQVPAPGLPDPRDEKTDACRPTGQGKLYSKPWGWEGAILEEGIQGYQHQSYRRPGD